MTNNQTIEELEYEINNMRKIHSDKIKSIKNKRQVADDIITFKSKSLSGFVIPNNYKKYTDKISTKNQALKIASDYRKEWGYGAKIIPVYDRKGNDILYPNYYVYVQRI